VEDMLLGLHIIDTLVLYRVELRIQESLILDINIVTVE
jgi:hypothetical protein